MRTNELYLAVLPLIHVSVNQTLGFGLTEQILTLFPDKDLATAFFEDEVQGYIDTFTNRANKYLTGGHVTGYEVHKEPSKHGDGRVIVRVTQTLQETKTA
jgi:hypothetical protein